MEIPQITTFNLSPNISCIYYNNRSTKSLQIFLTETSLYWRAIYMLRAIWLRAKGHTLGWNEDLLKETLGVDSFQGIDLPRRLFWGGTFRNTDFRDANLRGADFFDADLCGADLRGADLRGACFYRANLRFAQFDGADVEGAQFKFSLLHAADLSGVKNLTLWQCALAMYSEDTKLPAGITPDKIHQDWKEGRGRRRSPW